MLMIVVNLLCFYSEFPGLQNNLVLVWSLTHIQDLKNKTITGGD